MGEAEVVQAAREGSRTEEGPRKTRHHRPVASRRLAWRTHEQSSYMVDYLGIQCAPIVVRRGRAHASSARSKRKTSAQHAHSLRSGYAWREDTAALVGCHMSVEPEGAGGRTLDRKENREFIVN